MALTQVSSAGIKNAEVKTEDILDANITTAKIADDAVTSAKIATNSITATELASGSVGVNQLIDANITTAKIVDDAVTGAKIVDNAVGAEHIEVLDSHLQLADSCNIKLGTGDDLQIWHQTGNSYITSTGANLTLRAAGHLYLQDIDGNIMADFNDGGAVELYYDNSKKIETYSSGVEWHGNLKCEEDNSGVYLGVANDLQFYHDGTDSIIKDNRNSGTLRIQADSIGFNDKDVSETMLLATADGSVDLYYNGSKKFETTSAGVSTTGTSLHTDNIKITVDNGALWLGAGDDLGLWHDGSNSYIKNNTNALTALTGGFYINNVANSESMAAFNANGHCSLYYDNSKKFETTSAGTTTTGNATFTGHIYQGDNDAHFFGAGNDLTISHDGSNSYIHDSGTGSLILRSSRTSFNDANNNENARIDGDGLKFNGDSAEVNALHDYEEGSWTPAYENATSYASQVGHYTKIGRMVYAYFSINPYATSGSHAFINNLPFVCANHSGGGGGVAKGYQNYDIENGPIYYIEPNSTRIYFYKDNGTNFSAADGSGFNFRGVAVYQV